MKRAALSQLASTLTSGLLALTACSSANTAVVGTAGAANSSTGTGGASGGASATSSGGANMVGGNAAGGNAAGGNGSGGTTSTVSGGTKASGGSSAGGAASGGATAKGGATGLGGSSNGAGGNTSAGGAAVGGAAVGGAAVGGAAVGGAAVGGAAVGGAGAGNLHGCTTAISAATLNQEYATWKTAFVRDCSTTMGRVQAGGSAAGSESAETFSEGIGYGMLLAVSFNDQATFDKLWAYYKSARNAHGLMNWKMNACTGNYYDANGASDGDLDSAMALVMGDRRWGGYTADANALLDAIHSNETMVCGSQTVLRPGDAWGLECTTGSLNPSYFSPGYYRAFAVYQASQATFWNKFATDSVTMLLKYQSDAGGALMGEWSKTTGLADTSYGYNACRTPWRVAVDYVWWGTPDSQTFLTNVSTYVDANGGVANVPFDKNSAYLGPFALSGIATGKCEAYYQSWMAGAKYDDRYFQATLRVLNMLLIAGKFTY